MYATETKLDAVAGSTASKSQALFVMHVVEQAIINTVAYADVFDYPLLADEVHRYLIGPAVAAAVVQRALNQITASSQRLVSQQGYYFLPGREAIIDTRTKRHAISAELWPAARHYGRLIAQLPFVRMVAVTGSLAVNNMGHYRDVDYFIVTADDRLWLTRAMTIGIVRLAARRGVELCPNYFVSERALSIEDRTLYTAHEICQMVPLAGHDVYARFRMVNQWTGDFLPNAEGHPAPAEVATIEPDNPLRRPAESLLRSSAGRRLNDWEMARKIRKLSAAQQGERETRFTADCCKGHFNSHQNRTLQAYESRLSAAPNREPL